MKLNEMRLLIIAGAVFGLLVLGCGDSGSASCESDGQDPPPQDTAVAPDTTVAIDEGTPDTAQPPPPADTATPPPVDGTNPPTGPASCESNADCMGDNCSASAGFDCTCFEIPGQGKKICIPLCEKDEDCPQQGIELFCNGGMCGPAGQGPP